MIDALALHYYNLPAVLIIKLIILAVVGPLTLFWFAEKVQAAFSKRFSAQEGLIASKLLKYVGTTLIIIAILKEMGFSLSPLLGAAGIVGIALGFAAQTSTSNIISGFFLLAERPFQVGDQIQVNAAMGEVLTVDLLAVKLRTPDNKFIRIPNETMLKSDVVNLTKFPEKRIDIPLSVAYAANLQQVERALLDEAHQQPFVLFKPEPKVIFTELAASGINLSLQCWVKTREPLDVKSLLLVKAKERLTKEGIEIPFPHLVVKQA